ncbi:hypothetical protein VTN96DRAFT_2170 [Rasamsonia emersonii]
MTSTWFVNASMVGGLRDEKRKANNSPNLATLLKMTSVFFNTFNQTKRTGGSHTSIFFSLNSELAPASSGIAPSEPGITRVLSSLGTRAHQEGTVSRMRGRDANSSNSSSPIIMAGEPRGKPLLISLLKAFVRRWGITDKIAYRFGSGSAGSGISETFQSGLLKKNSISVRRPRVYP